MFTGAALPMARLNVTMNSTSEMRQNVPRSTAEFPFPFAPRDQVYMYVLDHLFCEDCITYQKLSSFRIPTFYLGESFNGSSVTILLFN